MRAAGVNVFVAYRRGLLPAPVHVPVLSSSPLLGDGQLCTEFAARCTTAATKLGVGIHRIHGAVRQRLRVVGVYKLPLVLYSYARELVDARTARRLPLPAPSRRARGGEGGDGSDDADEPAARRGAAVSADWPGRIIRLGWLVGCLFR
jgi:hypothetical protein